MSEGSGEQISPDGKWRWDGHNWVPHQGAAPEAPQAPQSPYGQPQSGTPYGQPQQPASPYGGQYPPRPYGFTPPQKSNTTRNVLLVIGLLALLLVGGCLAVVGLAANEIDNAVDEVTANDREPGGVDNPLEIEQGEAFDVYGFEYKAGWKILADDLGEADVVGLKYENQRDAIDDASVRIKLFQGNELLATVSCRSETAEVGQIVPLDCYSTDTMPAAYDKITIADAY
ncbi:hypothetical protein [Nocardioides lijunqiniae]|uniref:hypothetical protein n=1 Tax=Nocardioides lijunqiniae TaxID=2760832 RepID=UPI00187881DA|nr:hypothetical protein [Nocardioides lijunqiniae]